MSAGTGATHFIFSLPDEKWRKVIVVDVVEFDAEPGTVKVFSPFDMPKAKYENVHTWPVEEPYEEKLTETKGRIKNTLIFSDEKAEIIRKCFINSRMIFSETDKNTSSYYTTPYGACFLSFFPTLRNRSIRSRKQEKS